MGPIRRDDPATRKRTRRLHPGGAAGLMVASLLRFRVHCWLVTLPVFLLLGLTFGIARGRLRGWFRERRQSSRADCCMRRNVTTCLHAGDDRVTLRVQRPVQLTVLSSVAFVSRPRWNATSLAFRSLAEVDVAVSWPVLRSGTSLGIPLCLVLALVPLVMKRSRAMTYYWFTIGILLLFGGYPRRV